MRNLFAFITAIVLSLVSPSFALQVVTVTPTTTLSAETSNNTSAPNSISGATQGIATSGNISKMPFRDLMYAGANTKVYTTLLGWFGETGHIPIGYNSQDSALVGKQIEDMQSRGIDGTFLAWYGQDAYEDVVSKALRQQAEAHSGFTFGIMIDHGAITWDSVGLSPTDALIRHFNYIAQNYYSSPAYLHVNGRPVVLEFGMELDNNIDWNQVRANIQGNPIVISRNPLGFSRPTSDGGYAWGPADPINYLDSFYQTALQSFNSVVMGGSETGFNDSLASWTQHRFVDTRCGQTWLESIADAGKYYSSNRQLPFMMVATWNDYEEGTTIESGIDNCINVSAAASSKTLTWSLTGQGQENTVDHYTVFISPDGQNLMPLADVASGTHSFDLSAVTVPAGNYSLFVKAVGKSSITNHTSNAASFTSTTPPPPPTPTPAPGPTGDFTITPSASTTVNTVDAGQAATYSFTANTVSGPPGMVAMSCSGLPAGAACNFSPAALTLGSTASPVQLSIATTARTIAASAPFMLPYGALAAAGFVFAIPGKRRRKFSYTGASALVLVIGTVLLSAGCGGSGVASSKSPTTVTQSAVGTPSGTYTVTVSATGGGQTRSTSVQLTVK